ncbi:TadE/TadG family type IV pilus assembly protein [Devosia sp.]|uniref:TadE/TadG family type IV pilus assembly protein n=1 Tax=Devosia sp. TaxID=1871048 RepID=UPI002AFF35F6|nr:TadE/TadG family type IV pilus assembly protein [Devosia sp.]
MKQWRRFIGGEDGVSAIEFALLAPVLLALMLGSVTLYDAFRTNQIVAKVSSTIADMVSRKREITHASVVEMSDFMSETIPLSSEMPALRLTSVSNVGGKMTIKWSDKVGNVGLITTSSVDLTELPAIATGDSVIVTETYVPFTVMVTGFGLGSMVFRETLVNRPRFLKEIPFAS